MTFDKWFEKQSLLVKVILMIIPVVNWVLEVLVRASAFLRKNSGVNLIGLILGIVGNVIWGWVDLIVLILTGNLFLIE
jgi:hypothetical protein